VVQRDIQEGDFFKAVNRLLVILRKRKKRGYKWKMKFIVEVVENLL